MATKRTAAPHRSAKIEDIALGTMAVSDNVQRELKQHRVDYLVANFDLDDFGMPVVSRRDGKHYIIDGQHRVEALKTWLGDGWEIQKVPCRVYTSMTEQDEADMFDRLNDVLAVSAFDKFRIRVTAGRELEVAVDKIVRNLGLSVSKAKGGGTVGAVGTLVRVCKRSGPEVMARALTIIRDAYGDPGFEATIIDGVSLVCQRYNGSLNDDAVISRLRIARGGAGGLLGRAHVLKKQTGSSLSQCLAAAVVDTINTGRGGKKIAPWWKS